MTESINKTGLLIACFFYVSTGWAAELEAKLNWAEPEQYGFAVTGVVKKVEVQVGDKLEKGDALASLDSRPYQYRLKRCKAQQEKNSPAIFDAKLDFDHAEELYERTVLSEVELQRIESRYKALVAEQDAIKAECQLEQWRLNQASLKARGAAYVVSSSIVPGMVISNENKSAEYIRLVSATRASARALLSAQQKSQLKLANDIQVVFPQQNIPANIHSVAMQPDENGLYPVEFIFHYRQPVEPGKVVKVRY